MRTRNRHFIPKDKPRFWVVFVLAGLLGLLFGLVAFAAEWANLGWAAGPCKAAFFVAWLVAAFSGVGFAAGLLSGKYKSLSERPWKEQVW